MILDREQFVKALECCLKAKTFGDCEDLKCPAYRKEGCIYDNEDGLFAYAYVLIRELTEENERLIAESAKEFTCAFGQPHSVSDCPIAEAVAKAKADTVRKMWARLKEKAEIVSTYGNPTMVDLDDINQIAKDMLEETE